MTAAPMALNFHQIVDFNFSANKIDDDRAGFRSERKLVCIIKCSAGSFAIRRPASPARRARRRS